MHLFVLDLLSKDHGEGRLLHTHVCTPGKLEGEGGGGGLIIKVVPGGTDSRRIVVLGMMASSVLKRRVLISDVMFFSSKLLWKRALASTQGGSSIKKTLPDPGQDIELLQLESTSNVFFRTRGGTLCTSPVLNFNAITCLVVLISSALSDIRIFSYFLNVLRQFL